jgi:hypothetical protein
MKRCLIWLISRTRFLNYAITQLPNYPITRFSYRSYGFTPWLDEASRVSPGRPPVEVNVTVLAFIRLTPLFASEPATVTCSLIFSV